MSRKWHCQRSAPPIARSAGFSLVELNVAIIVGGILVLSVTAAMLAGADMSVGARDHVAVKQDVSFALRLIQHKVRGLYNDELQINGGADTLTLQPAEANPPVIQQVASSLVYVEGADTVTLIDGTLQSVVFALQTGENATDKLLSITLTLNVGGRSLVLPESLTLIRNRPS